MYLLVLLILEKWSKIQCWIFDRDLLRKSVKAAFPDFLYLCWPQDGVAETRKAMLSLDLLLRFVIELSLSTENLRDNDGKTRIICIKYTCSVFTVFENRPKSRIQHKGFSLEVHTGVRKSEITKPFFKSTRGNTKMAS